jgi:Fic-DOC domain mobile mystery protein B
MGNSLQQDGQGQTIISPGELLELKPSIATRAQLNDVERLNIINARNWAMRRATLKRKDLVTDHFARELHRRMFKDVWRWAGHFRKTERNLGWESHRIAEGVRVLLDDARFWLSEETYPLHEAMVRMHHRLVVVHPWVNGNGRHARLLADTIIASRGGTPLTWGARQDLANPGDARALYLEAVRAADQGDFGLLIRFSLS